MRRILLVLLTIVVVLAAVLVLRTVGGPGAERPGAPIALRPVDASRLAEILAGEGAKVARRTVAKYREAMGIAPSNERRRAPAH